MGMECQKVVVLSDWGCWGSRPAGLQLEGDRYLHTGGWPLGESPSWPSGLDSVVRHTVVVVAAQCAGCWCSRLLLYGVSFGWMVKFCCA